MTPGEMMFLVGWSGFGDRTVETRCARKTIIRERKISKDKTDSTDDSGGTTYLDSNGRLYVVRLCTFSPFATRRMFHIEFTSRAPFSIHPFMATTAAVYVQSCYTSKSLCLKSPRERESWTESTSTIVRVPSLKVALQNEWTRTRD